MPIKYIVCITNIRNIFQMVIEYIDILYFKALQNLSKEGFLV
jgi:hypothetical protein